MAGIVARACLRALAVTAAVMVVAAAGDLLMGLSRPVRALIVPLAVILAIATAALSLWRGRSARSLSAVALWIEERVPTLDYALVTAVEPPPPPTPVAAELEAAVDAVRWRSIVVRSVARAILRPAAVIVAATALLAAMPPGIIARVRSPAAGDAVARALPGRSESASRLAPLVATVTPPAYTGLRAFVAEEPASIAAITGSRVVLEGRGSDDGLRAELSGLSLSATGMEGKWRVSLLMPEKPAAARLRDRDYERLIVLEPRPDSSPVVTLIAPARDTVLREASGSIALAAEARDDLGLRAAWFEYIISSGEGESFSFKSGTVGRVSTTGNKSITLREPLAFELLQLAPGDIVHLRAVARDGNPVKGAGLGVSETRTVRIARRGEYDSVSVEGAPPPESATSALSQRMLIILTESLERRRPRLERRTVIGESRRISADQTRLRRRVGDMVFARLGAETSAEHEHAQDQRENLSPEELVAAAEEATGHAIGEQLDFAGGESPVIAINRPLLEAYNAMWDATLELNIGEPGRALPHMRAALAAIERARSAERIYVRGRPPAVVVDLARVRLAGEREPTAIAERSPRRALTGAPLARVFRFASAVRLLAESRGAGVDSLLLLRLELLTDAPVAADALGRAIDALRAGRDANPALARARRILEGGHHAPGPLRAWGWEVGGSAR